MIRLSTSDDIFAMGADSLLAVELIETIAEEFGTRISPAQLVANPTAARLAELLRNGIDDDTHPGLTTLFTSDHPTTAYWVLGTDEAFGPARLAQRTAPIRSFCTKVIGATPPERLLPSITAIGEANADTINRTRTTHTIIIGYSLGAALALETACALHRRNTPADLLVLIDPPTIESYATWTRTTRIPSPFRHPRRFLRMTRIHRASMRHPFVDGHGFEETIRLLHRHSTLFLDHTMIPYPGPTVEVLSDEFITAGGTSMLKAGLTDEPPRIRIATTHVDALIETEELGAALMTLLAERRLLPA